MWMMLSLEETKLSSTELHRSEISFLVPVGIIAQVSITLPIYHDLVQSELWVKVPVWLGTMIESEPVIEMPTECCVELRVDP